jgi:hypothetical protein
MLAMRDEAVRELVAREMRPDIVKRREDWFEGQLDLDPDRLVFIDETWASTNMARRQLTNRRFQTD